MFLANVVFEIYYSMCFCQGNKNAVFLEQKLKDWVHKRLSVLPHKFFLSACFTMNITKSYILIQRILHEMSRVLWTRQINVLIPHHPTLNLMPPPSIPPSLYSTSIKGLGRHDILLINRGCSRKELRQQKNYTKKVLSLIRIAAPLQR